MLGHLRLVVCQARHFGKALSARRFVLPLRVPYPGPTWAPPVRRRRTLGGVRVIHAQQGAETLS